MRKDIEVASNVCPMPVLMVAAYDSEGVVNVMNAAWGMTCKSDEVALFINAGHKTTKNLRETGAFSVSIADVPTMDVADYFGIATGNTLPNKFQITGYTATKSDKANAPIIAEFPLCMVCELVEVVQTSAMFAIVGKLVQVSADERILNGDGKVDVTKLNPLIFNQFGRDYYTLGDKAGDAWSAGKELVQKAKAGR